MDPKLRQSIRLVATLAIAGLVSGLILVVVFQATLPTIQRNQAEALQRAIFRVLPGTTRTAAMRIEDDRLVTVDDSSAGAGETTVVYTGYDDGGGFVGYAIAGEGAGFMDTVKLIYGFDPERRVITGMNVLESRETPGLGDKIVADTDFHRNFEALAVEPEIVPVKKGEKTAADQVDCISGATISSEAVVTILNRSTGDVLPKLDRVTPPTGEQRDE